ncbi:MAG: FAD-dependent oxidoreductase, partial [Anaerolineae bacterium]|nr:FAD-dependent oxidoreductase [Anaerolineae bacterium]
EQKALTGMSLADFTAGWSPTIQKLFAGLARSALAAHPEDVPASGFIAFLRFYSLLRRDAWAFDYLPGPGGACVAQPLADVACRLGCDIQSGARVVALHQDSSNEPEVSDHRPWQVVFECDDKRHTVEASHVVLALDAPSAEKLLCTSSATTDSTAGIRFQTGVPTAIIRLWFDTKPHSVAEGGIYTGDFVMDNFFWLDRLQPAYQAWSQASGGSAVEMHVYGPPEFLDQPDASLLAQVIVDTYRAFPELRGHLIHQVLLRNDATHTLFSVGKPGEHLAVETPWPNLYACGDWVYHPAPCLYLERATTTGIAAANALLTSLNMEPCPLLPHPEPEWLAGKLAGGLTRLRRRMSSKG